MCGEIFGLEEKLTAVAVELRRKTCALQCGEGEAGGGAWGEGGV